MKRRFFAFITVCMAVLLASFTGCYSPQENAPSVPTAPTQAAQTESGSGAEEPVEIKTYPLPEENVRANIIYAPSPSTGGFWTFAVFNASSIQAYDPVTRTSYIPCYQAGCKHNDESCTAYFGKEITALAEYRGNFYAMICYNDDTASALVTRPLSGGPLQTLASWEPENENEACRCALRCVSFGKAYVIANRETYALTEDGQLTTAAQESSLVSVDLQTGEISTILENCDNYDLYGVWEDIAVLRVLEMAEDAPEFEDWLAQQPEGTSWDEYDRQFVRYRFLTRNLQTGEESVLVDATENFVMTVDPHRSWGQYAVYQVDRSLYVYDLEKQAAKKLFTYEQNWDYYNYMILDGHVIAVCGTENSCRVRAINIADGTVTELTTLSGRGMAFSIEYECNGYFVGLMDSDEVAQYYISKEDFYRSNYDAAFR